MTVEDKRKQRQDRMKRLYERLKNIPNMPDKLVDDGTPHTEIPLDLSGALNQSIERDDKIKDAFKEKNKEVRQFVKDQDKATGVTDEEYKSERRLFLDENLFKDVKPAKKLKENKKANRSRKSLKESYTDDAFDLIDGISSTVRDAVEKGGDFDTEFSKALDNELIYSSDLWALAQHYDAFDSGEIMDRIYDLLYQDVREDVLG